jgi:MFS family permease
MLARKTSNRSGPSVRDTTLPPADTQSGILQRPYLWVTIGTCALVFLAAFESLAVTTIMPVVSRELHGADLYALAFAGPLATGVIGMVAAGNWSDRRGPTVPLYGSVALFVAGLLIAGTAVSMPLLVAGRLVQGLGGGALTVALYVLVARIYPGLLHPKIFAAFSAAWVIPSLVGPFAAGMVAQVFSWHWVFLGVVGLVIPALVMIVPVLRNMAPAREPGGVPAQPPAPWALGRLAWASLAALAVLGLNLSREVRLPGFAAAPALLAVAAVVIALLAVRPLVPRGTLAARRGLPSVILVRGLASAGFFGAEVYLPYLLIEQYAFSPTFAGLTLTGGALAWAGAAAVQGRLGTRLSHRGAVRIGS